MPGRRCAYLTMDDSSGWSIDCDLAFPPLEALGWQLEAVPWRAAEVDWNRFDAVYIGTPWDYPEDPQRFMRVLEAIVSAGPILVNDIELVRWTLPKTYLRDLEQLGVAIVPSIWGDEISAAILKNAFDHFRTDRIIVKPIVSTNATDTFLLQLENFQTFATQIFQVFASRSFVVQPFIDNVRSEGEYSLFYFNRRFSHAICKIPRPADFRVQEEFGATISSVEPEADLASAGAAVMRLVEPLPAYARVDFVRGPDDRFLLMELELIEPSMYLRMHPSAPQRFADAFDAYVSAKLEEDT